MRQIKLNKKQGVGNNNNFKKETGTYKSTYICYHFPPGLVPLPVVGPLLFLLQHALPCCAVLQGKFAQDLAEAMYADLTYGINWMAQEDQKSMKPTDVRQKQHITVRTFPWQEYMIHGEFSLEK